MGRGLLVQALLGVILLLGCHAVRAGEGAPRGVSVVEPVEGSAKLRVNEQGLKVLRALRGPFAPVVVIGPYRTGKSFLVNQMLQESCDKGMKVGHTRTTETRGVWFWPTPLPVPNRNLSLLFFDTEGFESTGKSDAYDDRIFAFAAVVSSTLVYNLAEAVRESDIEKLSFAVEVAKAFYVPYAGNGRKEHSGGLRDAAPATRTSLEPIHMVWVIQRDFLGGSSVQTALKQALGVVPNPRKDEAIAQVNGIRASLAQLTNDSTAYGLPQPHLDRTRLCELPDAELAEAYRTARDDLRTHLFTSARPKTLRGSPLSGDGLADLIVALVAALNDRQMPTSGSMLEVFNSKLLQDCINIHATALEQLQLPVAEEELDNVHRQAFEKAVAKLEDESFGSALSVLLAKMSAQVEKDYASAKDRNEIQSRRLCELWEQRCEDVFERNAGMLLPSLRRFHRQTDACLQQFGKACVGPALEAQDGRLHHALRRETSRFEKEYHSRLHTNLIVLSVLIALVGRFWLKRALVEFLGWGLLFVLEIYPVAHFGTGAMYDTWWWEAIVSACEVVLASWLFDAEKAWVLLLAIVAVAGLWRWCWLRWRFMRVQKSPPEGAGRDLSV